MRSVLAAWLFLWFLPARAENGGRPVVLLSMDGFAASYFPNASLRTLERLREEGAYAELTPSFPTLTFPNHVTLATGCPPGKHGIVANRFLDKERGEFSFSDDPSWLECEPIWITAERNGVRAGVAHWPLSYGAWKNRSATYHSEKFDRRQTNEERLSELLALARKPEKERPRLLVGYVTEPDHTAHNKGPGSEAVRRKLEQLDRSLKRLVSRLDRIPGFAPYTLVLVSDHGMAEAHGTISLREFLEKNHVGGVPNAGGPLMGFYLWKLSDRDRIAELFGTIPGFHVYTSRTLPPAWGPYHPRMGDVFGYLDPPLSFYDVGDREPARGHHGYPPELPSMRGILLAWGEGIARGKSLGLYRNLDVASTLSALLGIPPPEQNEGKKIPIEMESVQKGTVTPKETSGAFSGNDPR